MKEGEEVTWDLSETGNTTPIDSGGVVMRIRIYIVVRVTNVRSVCVCRRWSVK
jgi:hypothetical protein